MRMKESGPISMHGWVWAVLLLHVVVHNVTRALEHAARTLGCIMARPQSVARADTCVHAPASAPAQRTSSKHLPLVTRLALDHVDVCGGGLLANAVDLATFFGTLQQRRVAVCLGRLCFRSEKPQVDDLAVVVQPRLPPPVRGARHAGLHPLMTKGRCE